MKVRDIKRRAFLSTSLAGVAAHNLSAQSPAQHQITVGDDRLRVVLECGSRGITESAYHIDGAPFIDLRGRPAFSLELDHATMTPEGSSCELRHADGGAVIFGSGRGIQWQLQYRASGMGRITKSLRVQFESNTVVRSVGLWTAESGVSPRLARTKIQEFAAFFRDQSRGMFVSLDFPFSRIAHDRSITTVGYRPYDAVSAGQWYEYHSLTIGAVRLTGDPPSGFDSGEIDAFDAYIQEHQPLRFDKPMNVYASIVNRYTQVRGDTVFYSMKDQPTLAFNTSLVERDLALMPKLGLEYYQVFPGAFEWAPDDTRSEVSRLVGIARQRGLRIGDYSGTTTVYSPHFNIGGNVLNRPEWLVRDAGGKTLKQTYCFGNAEFERYYTETVASNCRRFGFEMHCLDLLRLTPCHATGHGHPPGEESLYHQVRGLLRMLVAVNAVAPQMMTWPNSGDWLEILPKLAWYSPNLYLTDPFIETPWQGLNMTRLLDDSRREQMVALHHQTFLPYRFFTNCQYFFSQTSVVPDIRNFEYGALSTLAVTPNLCLGEFRPWLESLSPTDQDRVFAFYQRWTKLIADHYALWNQTREGGEKPGPGAVEVYSHAAADHGFVFLINPNYWDRTYEIALDGTLGFKTDGRCEIVELYPMERRRLTNQGPWPGFGTKVPIAMPAQSVTVLEIRPAPRSVSEPILYGVPGTIDSSSGGYRVKISGPQGRTERVAVILPPSAGVIDSATVLPHSNEPDPRLAVPTAIKLLASQKEGALMEVTFRRGLTPTQLRDWKAKAAELHIGIAAGWNKGLPPSRAHRFPLFVDSDIPMPLTPAEAKRSGLGTAANFCGAYIENAFSEIQETWIELGLGGSAKPNANPLATVDQARPRLTLSSISRAGNRDWWFETTFDLPFLFQIGAEPSPAEHTLAVFPLLRAEQAQIVKAWINGAELTVERYHYPRNRKLSCYYADLVGSAARGGLNMLVVHLRF